jgi:PAS domain S-box-containing protein
MQRMDDVRARLREVEDPLALLEGMFTHSPFGLQVYDASGRSVLVNDAFRRIFHAEPPPEYNILKDEIAEKQGVLVLIHRAFAGETVHIPPIWYDPRELGQVKIEHARRAAISSTFFPLRGRDGQVRHVAIAFKDVTDELEARDQAESERDLLRAIFEQSGDGIIVCDEKGVVRAFNPEAERQRGRPRQALPPERWIEGNGLCAPDGGPITLEALPLYRALQGERVTDARWAIRRPDGSLRRMTGTARPLRHADGSPAGAVLTSRDETERLALEERVRRESERNQRLYEQAQELHRIKDEFLATVSHELRTPLQAILGWARVLREPSLEGDDDRRRRGLETIERNARLQAQLIDDILDVSRMVAGKMALEWGEVDLAAVLRAVVDGLQPAATVKGLHLELAAEGGPLSVPGDVERLRQVFWNVVSNAVKFTPEGGRIAVRAGRQGTEVVVRVEDSGVGIDAAFLPHAFDRFRQFDSSTTRAHGGLGLGLAIVRHLVEMHGGTVQAESGGRGQGAVFTIRLRARRLPDGPHPARDSPPPPSARLDGVRVLVVDDERDTRDLLATALERRGAVVQTAASAADAIAVLRRGGCDVLVSDIGMPDQDGYDLITALRALEAAQGGAIPAVALTAYARAEDRRRALAAGYQVHVSKPVDPDELVAVLARVTHRGGPGGSEAPV